MNDLPASEVIEAQPLDIQHDTDPADDHGNARRIPHLGHALLFFAIVGFTLIASLLAMYAVVHIRTQHAALEHPGYSIAAQAIAYVSALLLSLAIFPKLWHRSFFSGVHWNGLVARRQLVRILGLGLAVSVGAQLAMKLVEHFFKMPENAPVDQIMMNPHLIWWMVPFAVVLGPFMEELAFRGFLLPALATAYDWLSLERTPAGLDRWNRSTKHSTPALIFSALISSAPFALMHASQIGDAWGIVGILYCVSLALSFIRIRSGSLACSTLVHASYNFVIFAMLFAASDGFKHLEKVAH
jgi:membrane protease YdiL (CAAX protease family)